MNLTLTIVRKSKKRNKLYYTAGGWPLNVAMGCLKLAIGMIILDLFFAVTTISNHLTFANKVQLNSYYYLC